MTREERRALEAVADAATVAAREYGGIQRRGKRVFVLLPLVAAGRLQQAVKVLLAERGCAAPPSSRADTGGKA